MTYVEAQHLQPGMVVDYGPWLPWGCPPEWQSALVAAPPVEVDPAGLVEVLFVGGPPPLQVASDWPMELDTPAAADLRDNLITEESERLLPPTWRS